MVERNTILYQVYPCPRYFTFPQTNPNGALDALFSTLLPSLQMKKNDALKVSVSLVHSGITSKGEDWL